ncbi:unnamed protein product [Ceutorhynchus assimilis]|uniref:SIN3-HDAC complex-associated factor n=1 Tax=Ceutorhynchus assimilis TaxID=467358 RepID=A0A9N9MWC2_9CUCU|nr:unnamed protein product [Ceutorhynchus assimilis]
MFSFHKPKVYRSSTGCCICKAKSSSSRFTDSKKYEEDFLECFKLVTPRQGEICNACVLLVKRWKKLPVGSDRHWQHVVDARAGPGMKSFTKFKTKNKKLSGEKSVDKIKKKHFEREYSPALSDKSEDMDINDIDFLSEEAPSMSSSHNGSPGVSDNEDTVEQKNRSRRRKGKSKKWNQARHNVCGFIDLDYWKKEATCCGTIFRGQSNEIMLELGTMKPCQRRITMCKAKAQITQTPIVVVASKGSYSDNSSDSGYDDYSNQGVAMSPEAQLNQANQVNIVPDLMCHETIFQQEEEMDLSPTSVGCFQPQETVVRN